MTVEEMRAILSERVLHGAGESTGAERRAAFDDAPTAPPLVAKVALAAWRVTDEDIAAAKGAGLSDDQIFELVVCAAIGKATRQLDAALTALAAVEDA